MWSQLRDISIRVDEDAERGTPLNVSKCYALVSTHANANEGKIMISSCNRPSDETEFTNANR
jgi:hypothetical protein